MTYYLKNIFFVCMMSLILNACQTTQTAFDTDDHDEQSFGLTLLDETEKDASSQNITTYLDIAVEVFDPGISEDIESYKENNIWPSLRRAETNRFAFKLKEALENKEIFGAVRVVPNKEVSSDLLIRSVMIKSDSKNVAYTLSIYDSSGKKWGEKEFSYTVKPSFHEDLLNQNRDAYDPIFKQSANYVEELLYKHKNEDLQNIKNITNIKYAHAFSPETFDQYIDIKNGKAKLLALPSDSDPMLYRIEAIKAHDDAFIDRLQHHYKDFADMMEPSYIAWQNETYYEINALEEAEKKRNYQ